MHRSSEALRVSPSECSTSRQRSVVYTGWSLSSARSSSAGGSRRHGHATGASVTRVSCPSHARALSWPTASARVITTDTGQGALLAVGRHVSARARSWLAEAVEANGSDGAAEVAEAAQAYGSDGAAEVAEAAQAYGSDGAAEVAEAAQAEGATEGAACASLDPGSPIPMRARFAGCAADPLPRSRVPRSGSGARGTGCGAAACNRATACGFGAERPTVTPQMGRSRVQCK